MEKQSERIVSPVTLIVIVLALIALALGSFIIVLRPNIVWGSEQKLLNMMQSTAPIHYNLLTSEEVQRFNQVVKTNEHVFILNSVYRNNDENAVCIVHSTRTPSLTAFGNGVEQSKTVGAIYLTDAAGFVEFKRMPSDSGFSTDAVDTVSWFNCFENVPEVVEDFLLTLGQRGVPGKYAEFAITIE